MAWATYQAWNQRDILLHVFIDSICWDKTVEFFNFAIVQVLLEAVKADPIRESDETHPSDREILRDKW